MEGINVQSLRRLARTGEWGGSVGVVGSSFAQSRHTNNSNNGRFAVFRFHEVVQQHSVGVRRVGSCSWE